MKRKLTVLGLGNLLNSDEGVGVHAVRALQQQFAAAYPDAEFVDGGTLGLNLLPWVESSTHLLLLDCVDGHQAPGTLVELSKEQIPLYAGVKMSLHQTTFQEVLALAGVRGHLPEHLHLIGVQPVSLQLGTELSPAVQAELPRILERAQAVVRQWEGC